MDLIIPVCCLTAVIGFSCPGCVAHRVREFPDALPGHGTARRLRPFSWQAILFAAVLWPVLVWLQISGQTAGLAGLFALCYGCGIVLSISVLRHRSVLDVLLDPT